MSWEILLFQFHFMTIFVQFDEKKAFRREEIADIGLNAVSKLRGEKCIHSRSRFGCHILFETQNNKKVVVLRKIAKCLFLGPGNSFFLTTVVRRFRRYAATVIFYPLFIEEFFPWTSVRRLLWAHFLWRLAQRDTIFMLSILPRTVSIPSLVFSVRIPNPFGTGPEWTPSLGFNRILSSLDTAPKVPLYVLLNTWDSLFATVPSISPNTWVM